MTIALFDPQPSDSVKHTLAALPTRNAFDGLAYLAARTRIARRVAEVLRHRSFAGVVGGSWARGDFHLSTDGRHSYSDLDLQLPGADATVRSAVGEEIQAALRAENVTIPVSVHPGESFGQMNFEHQKLFALTEYLMAELTTTDDYGRAKALLMLSRRDESETGWDAGERLGLDSALQVKLGVTPTIAELDVLRAGIDSTMVGGRTVAEWLSTPRESLLDLMAIFDSEHHRTGEWIYRRVIDKINGALTPQP